MAGMCPIEGVAAWLTRPPCSRTVARVQNLARKFVQRPPSMAVFGNSTQVPLYEDVKRYFADVASNLPKQ